MPFSHFQFNNKILILRMRIPRTKAVGHQLKQKKREKNHSLERACSRSHGGTHRDDDDAHKTHSIPPRSFLIIKNQRVYLYLCVCLARIVDCSPRLINFLDRVALFFILNCDHLATGSSKIEMGGGLRMK